MTEPEKARDSNDQSETNARRRHTRLLAWSMVSAFVAITVVGTFQDQFEPRQSAIRVAFNAVIMTLTLFGMLWLRKRGVHWLQPPPGMRLDKRQRRAAARALRPGGVVAPEDRAATVEVARHAAQYRWGPWFFLACGVACGVSAVAAVGPARWLQVAIAIMAVGMAVYQAMTLHRANAIIGDDLAER